MYTCTYKGRNSEDMELDRNGKVAVEEGVMKTHMTQKLKEHWGRRAQSNRISSREYKVKLF